MQLRLSDLAERFRASLFLVPSIAVLSAIVAAAVMIGIDRRLDDQGSDLPLALTSTVESARVMLSVIAGATITFAAIAFSVSLLIIQQASSQYSPRVVHTLFRDPFNKRVMGLVVGTFTYCLVVLRSVRTSAESGGEPIVPDLAVAIAVILGIATILAIVAFIDHSAHSMDVSKILEDVQRESTGQICREWSLAAEGVDERTAEEPPTVPDEPAHVVRFDVNGWIQQVDVEELLACVPEGADMWVDAFPGRYAIAGTPLGHLSRSPEDPDTTDAHMRRAVSTGDTRTMQQDVSFGVRQLTDVALKALSPGVNDPTTAQDAIFHTTAVLAELLRREPPPVVHTYEGDRRLVLSQQPTYTDLVNLAFDETRLAAAAQPTVCIYLLESLALLDESVDADESDARVIALTAQARLVVSGCEESGMLPSDLGRVRQAYLARFPVA
jgi:uncharacterized membrane protein